MAKKNVFDELNKIPDTTELDDLFRVESNVKETKKKVKKVKSKNLSDVFNSESDKDAKVISDIVKSISNGKYTNTNLMDVAEKLDNVKEKNLSRFTKLLTVLSLYSGNDNDFAELQAKCGYEDTLSVQTFYEQLYDISIGNHAEVSDFTRVVYDNSNAFIDNLKNLVTPSINDYIKRTQFDRRNKDANLSDQNFCNDYQGLAEIRSRELVIPKGVSPYEVDAKTGLKFYDTVCAVPKAFYKKNKLDPKLYGVSDSPLIRSRKTRYQLFTAKEQQCDNMENIIDSLANTFNAKINLVEYADEINGSNKEYKFFKKHAEENDFKYKGELYVKRSRINYSNASDVRRNAEGKVNSNDNEMVAYAIKALANDYFDKDKKAYRAKIAHNIAINGGFCNINKKAKHFYPFIRECASIMATRMVLYSIDLDGKDKNVNFKLDQGLEFALANKLATFPDLKAKWVLPSIKGMAKYFAFEYFRKAGIAPKQIALGMERARQHVDEFRDIPASMATVDDYSKVIFGTFDLCGSFEMQNIVVNTRTRESFDIFNVEDVKDDTKLRLFEELNKGEDEVVEPVKEIIEEKAAEVEEKEMARGQAMTNAIGDATTDAVVRSPYYQKIYDQVKKECEEKGYNQVAARIYGDTVEIEEPPVVEEKVAVKQEVIQEPKKEEVKKPKQRPLLLPYTVKDAVKQKAQEDALSEIIYTKDKNEPVMYVDNNGIVSFELQSLREKVKEEVITIESDVVDEEEIAAIKETKAHGYAKEDEVVSKLVEKETVTSETKVEEKVVTEEVVEAKEVQEVKAEEKPTLKLPRNLTSKLKKDIPQMFNSYLQKFKLNIEKRLDELIESTKGKNITPNKKAKIDEVKAKLEFINKVIFNYLETNSELAKLNKFSSKKVMDNDKLFDRIAGNHEDMIIYMVQKQFEDKTNEIIVGINLMVEKKPEAYNGYTVKRLVNEYASQKGLDLKKYAGNILVRYSKGFDWTRENKILAKTTTKTKVITKTKTNTQLIETAQTVEETQVSNTSNEHLEKGEHNDGK